MTLDEFAQRNAHLFFDVARPLDMASSTTQGWFTWPEIAKSFVPALFGRPKPENQDAPRRRMVGATAIDSTLFTVVGQP